MLIYSIPEDLDELFQNGGLAPIALLRKLCRIVEVAIDIAFVFVVGVLCAEDGGTDAAGEVLDVVFAVERGDVGAPERAAAGVAEEIETPEVVGFAQWVLVGRMVGDGEELGSYYFVAVLQSSPSSVCIRGVIPSR